VLFLGGTEPGRALGVDLLTCACRCPSSSTVGVSGRHFGLDGTVRGPGGALVARGGSLSRASDGIACGLGMPRASVGMPVEVEGRLGLSLPMPYSDDVLLL